LIFLTHFARQLSELGFPLPRKIFSWIPAGVPGKLVTTDIAHIAAEIESRGKTEKRDQVNRRFRP